MTRVRARWLASRLPGNTKTQKSLTDDDFITVLQGLTVTGNQTAAAIYKSSIRRSQILNNVLAVTQRNAGMTPGHLGFGVVRIQIDIREDPAIRIPAANIGVLVAQRKLLARGVATFYYERGVHTVA